MTLFAFCARNALRSRGMPVRFLSTLKENPSIVCDLHENLPTPPGSIHTFAGC